MPIGAFVVGGAFFVVSDRAVHIVQSRFGGGEAQAGPWLIFFATAIDLLTDGLTIGTGTVVASSLCLLLALAQMVGDAPEGFATIASFRAGGVPRRRRLAINAAFAMPILLGALIGFFALRDAS